MKRMKEMGRVGWETENGNEHNHPHDHPVEREVKIYSSSCLIPSRNGSS